MRILSILFMFVLVSCANVQELAPRNQQEAYAATEQSFTASVMLVNDMYKDKLITWEQLQAFKPYIIIINNALDGWHVALSEDEPAKIAEYAALARSTLAQFKQEIKHVTDESNNRCLYRFTADFEYICVNA